MRTRKLLSLFLAALMVFTTAFVAVHVSADDGTITLAAGEKPADKSDLSYKDADGKFLVWKDEAGALYAHNAAVDAEVALTPVYKSVEVVDATDFAAIYEAGKDATSGTSFANFPYFKTAGATAAGGLSEDGTAFRLFPTAKSAGHYIKYAFATPKTKAEFAAARLVFEQSHSTGNDPWVYLGGGVATSDTKVAYNYNTTAGANGLHHYDLLISTETVTDETIAAVRIVNWGAAIWQATEPYPRDDVYVDLHYFAFFDDEAAADLFDYDAYTAPIVEEEETTEDESSEIDSSDDSTEADSSEVDSSENPSEEESSSEEEYVPGEIYVASPDDLLAQSAGKSLAFSKVKVDGKTYFRAAQTATSGNAINWTLPEALDPAKVNFVLVSYRTNIKTAMGFSTQLAKDADFNFAKVYFITYGENYAEMNEVRSGNMLVDITGKAIANGATEFKYFRIIPWNGQPASSYIDGETTGWFDIEYVALFENEADIEGFDISDYIEEEESEEESTTETITDPNAITVAAGKAPKEVSDLPYLEDGKFLAWEDANGKVYSHTEKVDAEVVLVPVYTKFHVIAASLGTLDKALPRDATMSGPSLTTENGVTFNRYTGTVGALTSDSGTQVNIYIGDYIAPMYTETPYVAYKYRTTIGYTNWTTSFASHNYVGYTDIRWTQTVSGIVADGEWHIASHKPADFGDSTNTKALAAFRIAPYNAKKNVEIKANEYIDLEYVLFLEKDTYAAAFDLAEYAESLKIEYKIKVNGVVYTVGNYVEGSSVTLPIVENVEGKILTGYKNSAGAIVAEGVATTEILEYTPVYRNAPKGDYINERGNLGNLKAKLDAGKLNVVYLGGSVTVGAGSSGRGSWVNRVTDYFKAEYPEAEINGINVGIGGTGSRLGSYRLAEDVIAKNPDLVFVEFMLNDAYNGEYSGNVYKAGKYYEYILRTIREELPNTEIITLFITDSSAAKNYGYGTPHPITVEMDKVAENYDVTSIDIGRYMLESIFNGDKQFDETTWKVYVTDGVHCGNLGYAIYAEIISKYLDGAKTTNMQPYAYDVPSTLIYPAAAGFNPITLPLTLDGTTINPAIKNVNGFVLGGNNTSPAYSYKLAPTGSTASIEFEFKGTELALYMNSPNAEATIKVTVDGVTKTQGGQADTNGPKEFFEGLENTTHVAKVELTGVTSNGNILGILVGADEDVVIEPDDPGDDPSGEPTDVPGDVNGDGKITRPDLIRLTQYFANWDVAIDEFGADTTGDGKITRPDLIRLTQYFANWDVELGK